MELTSSDERVVWVRKRPGRKLVLILEPIPDGFSITTQWLQGENLERQDCEIAVMRGLESTGIANKEK